MRIAESRRTVSCLFVLLLALSCSEAPTQPPGQPGPPVQEPADITLDATRTHQTIVGWEAHAQSGEDDVPEFPLYADTLFDLVVHDLGINRVRLEVRSGAENRIDYYAQWRAGVIDDATWRCKRWETINDNADPNVIDANGFKFGALDMQIDRVVKPLRQRLADRGEKLYVNLNYVAFVKQCTNIPYIHHDPAEYAELILAVFEHMERKHGFVPDGVEVVLEPDNTDWTGASMGHALVHTATLLESKGYRPEFIGPSTTHMQRALTFFDDMVKVPGVLSYLREYSYHRYGGRTPANLAGIASRASQYGLRTSMLEWIGADYHVLHEDLKAGQAAAWQQFAIAFTGNGAGGAVLFGLDRSSPGAPRVFYAPRTKFLRQYFRFVRAGARRIEATSTLTAFDPVAFVNPNGRYVVVVKAATGGAFTIGSLPAGTYGIKYTTDAAFDVDLTDVQLAAGKALPASIPAAGVVTIHAK